MLVEKRTDDNSLLAAVPSYNEQLEAHYSIERGPSTKALGRRTQMIMVQPRDQYRYGYRLWLDQETAMPLKSQLCDRNGNVIEQILFAELNFRDRIPARDAEARRLRRRLPLAAPGRAAAALADVAGRAGTSIRLPAGFRLHDAGACRSIAGSTRPVRHLVYSDGLASVSVFIEPRNPQTDADAAAWRRSARRLPIRAISTATRSRRSAKCLPPRSRRSPPV